MDVIFSIQGGIGKSVMATAVCKAIKKTYPNSNTIVVTGYPEVFVNNPNIDMVFSHGQQSYFYSKYIEGKDVKIMANEPYNVTEHILYKEHLIETWCKMNGLDYSGEQPEVFINQRERTYFMNKYSIEKPIMILQTNGGAPTQETVHMNPLAVKYSWARDMPKYVAEAVIETFHNKYQIFHLRRDDQFSFENTTHLSDSFKAVSFLIGISEKRVLIDSFAQHTAAALQKPSTVLWIANKPNVFGYDIHDNIIANPETAKPDLRYSFLSKYNITGAPNEFPYYYERDMFNIDRIIDSIMNQPPSL
jgi:hypothetical protein